MKKQFNYETIQHREYGSVIVLRSTDESGKEQKLYLAPDYGFNLIGYEAGQEDLIYTRPETLRNEGFSGIPVLYPTPNRVKDARFQFKGKIYSIEKNGVPRYLHGLVYDEKWTAGRPEFTEQGVKVCAWIEFKEGSAPYQSFPWRHTLKVSWELTVNGIRLEYEVHNQGQEELPFGFAIHPFFPVYAFGETAKIRVPAKQVFESTPDRFPTGKILKTGGTGFDLSRPREVTSLSLDDVYTGLSGQEAEISYGRNRLVLSASSEFDKMVVFTPEEDFFCLENQTCMTDAHNFYNKGYEKSGLIIAEPGSVHRGWIEMTAYI